MKVIISTILLIFLFFISCNSNIEKAQDQKEAVVVDTIKLKIDSAKLYLDSAHYFVSKGIKGEMSMTKSNKLSGPLMEKFQKIYKSLPDVDTLLLYEYRVKKINELIDLQIEFNK